MHSFFTDNLSARHNFFRNDFDALGISTVSTNESPPWFRQKFRKLKISQNVWREALPSFLLQVEMRKQEIMHIQCNTFRAVSDFASTIVPERAR